MSAYLEGHGLSCLKDRVEHERLVRNIKLSMQDSKKWQPPSSMTQLQQRLAGSPDEEVDSLLALRERLYLYRLPTREAQPNLTHLNTFVYSPKWHSKVCGDKSDPDLYRARVVEMMTSSMELVFKMTCWPAPSKHKCRAMALRLMQLHKLKLLKPGQHLRFLPGIPPEEMAAASKQALTNAVPTQPPSSSGLEGATAAASPRQQAVTGTASGAKQAQGHQKEAAASSASIAAEDAPADAQTRTSRAAAGNATSAERLTAESVRNHRATAYPLPADPAEESFAHRAEAGRKAEEAADLLLLELEREEAARQKTADKAKARKARAKKGKRARHGQQGDDLHFKMSRQSVSDIQIWSGVLQQKNGCMSCRPGPCCN